jgi:protein phosphatase 2C family protein 2/3
MVVSDRSGSCAIVILIVGEICYCANVGDSRAIISTDCGRFIYPLSQDHKPSELNEYRRIIKNGGQVYQTTTSRVLEKNLGS